MITHENLVSSVFQSVGAWACPNGGNCDCDCGECAERLVKEYEDALREEGKQKALAEMNDLGKFYSEIRADERNKTIDEILQTIRNGMSELLESPWANGSYMRQHNYAVKEAIGVIDDLILKKDIEQMKEGGKNG